MRRRKSGSWEAWMVLYLPSQWVFLAEMNLVISSHNDWCRTTIFGSDPLHSIVIQWVSWFISRFTILQYTGSCWDMLLQLSNPVALTLSMPQARMKRPQGHLSKDQPLEIGSQVAWAEIAVDFSYSSLHSVVGITFATKSLQRMDRLYNNHIRDHTSK